MDVWLMRQQSGNPRLVLYEWGDSEDVESVLNLEIASTSS